MKDWGKKYGFVILVFFCLILKEFMSSASYGYFKHNFHHQITFTEKNTA